MTGTTRVALVEDHEIFADALRVCLEQLGFEAVNVPLAQAGVSCGELLHEVTSTRPRVVLLDLDLGPAGDGSALIRPLTESGHRVVVLTALQDRVRWGECLANGALTVVTKLDPLEAIVEVIRRVDDGLAVLSHEERDTLVREWEQRHTDEDEVRTLLARLTPREAHVLAQLTHGKRVREVAEEAFVSEETVRTHVKSIFAKLGVNSQLAAVAMARDIGWAPPQQHDYSGETTDTTDT